MVTEIQLTYKSSQADIDLTRKLRDGGTLSEIQLLDHLIVTVEGYSDFHRHGICIVLAAAPHSKYFLANSVPCPSPIKIHSFPNH